jgi:hypothetical protein
MIKALIMLNQELYHFKDPLIAILTQLPMYMYSSFIYLFKEVIARYRLSAVHICIYTIFHAFLFAYCMLYLHVILCTDCICKFVVVIPR